MIMSNWSDKSEFKARVKEFAEKWILMLKHLLSDL